MKVKSIATILVLALLAGLTAIPVFAAEPGMIYEANKLTAAVSVDGVNSPGEWDDANVLVCNSDSEIFKNYGRWQGAEGNKTYGPNELSVTYRIKWDEQYLYILEERLDTNFKFQAGKTASEPWCGDGTLFFLAYDNGAAKIANIFEPFWVNKIDNGKMSVGLRLADDSGAVTAAVSDADSPATFAGWKFAGTNKDNVYTSELQIPFADMNVAGALPAIAEGLKFWMTPVIPNMDGDEPFLEDWNQMNFHDRGLRDDADLTENANSAESPVNWGRMILAAAKPAPVVDVPAEDVPPAPAVDTPEVVSTPVTADSTVVFVLLALASVAAFAVVKKVRVK